MGKRIYENRVFDSKGVADPSVEIQFGPNIKDWPAMSALPEHMVLKVVSEITTPTAVLLQGSSAPPTATMPHAQGTSTSSTATLACTQGSGTSLPDTLAHSYNPIVHLDPLLASIKGRSRAFMREGRAGEGADEQALTLSLSRERL